MLVDEPLRDLVSDFAAPTPTPGGGSAAAAAGAMGTALLVMITSLPKTRTNADEERLLLAAAQAALLPIQHQLTAAVDADAAAYDQVVAAYRLPKGTDAERASRAAAIQRALRDATDVPLGIMRSCASALKQAIVVGAHGHAAAASDARVGVALVRTALEGAGWNAESNLQAVKDAAYVEAVRGDAQRLASAGARDAAEAERLLLRAG